MIALSLSVFLLSLSVFLASLTHGPGVALEQWLFRGEFSPLFVGHILVVLLTSRAVSSQRRAGKPLWRFYRDKPRWAGIVQLVLLLAMMALLFFGPKGHVQREVSSSGVVLCIQETEGRSVVLDDAACEALRLNGLRTFTAIWSALSFFALTQVALSGRRQRDTT